MAPASLRTPKSPERLTKPATWACRPVIANAASPFFTFNGADTETSPTATVTVRFSMSTPVLLKATPTPVALALAKPLPRLRSAAPVACRANFWSPRTIRATVALLTPARTKVPAVSDAAAWLETMSNSSWATVAPGVFWMPKSPDRFTKPATCACNPVTTKAAWPFFTFNGADTDTSPTATVTVRFTMSAPVLLKATPTAVALALAKPSPRLSSAAPVAWSASFWSPRIITATVALLTPARTSVPAVSAAAAWLETISNSSWAAVAPAVFWMAKLPDRLTKPATCACKPVTTRAAWPFFTFNGAETETSPTATVTVRFTMSAPVLLKATPTAVALALAKPPPRLRSTAPVACNAIF